MTAAARSWLPVGAELPATLNEAVANLVHVWSLRWCAGARYDVSGFDSHDRTDSKNWRVLDDVLALEYSDETLRRLGLDMLGLEATSSSVSPADKTFLSKLGERAIDNFKSELAVLVGCRSGNAWMNRFPSDFRHGTVVSDAGGHRLIGMALSESLGNRLIRAALPPAPVKVGSGVGALGAISVRLAASVGDCRLTIAELDALTPGDVLVLDRPLSADFALAINGTRSASGSCTLASNGEAQAIRIVEPAL